MGTIRKKRTLFEVVPALGAIAQQGRGVFKLIPSGFAHESFTLDPFQTLGRDSSRSNLVIRSEHISRLHCEIVLHDDTVWVRDLGSQNGTWVNHQRVSGAELHPVQVGDHIGLSQYVRFVLARDDAMVAPTNIEVSAEDFREQPTFLGEAARLKESTAPGPPPGPGELDLGLSAAAPPPSSEQQLGELERQRNVLAILYQISLSCLATDDLDEVDELLTNVFSRAVPMDAGLLMYLRGGSWRVVVCPGSTMAPTRELVRALFQAASQSSEPQELRGHQARESFGPSVGAALVAPLLNHDEHMVGLLGAIRSGPRTFEPDVVDFMRQLAAVAAARLRDRPSN